MFLFIRSSTNPGPRVSRIQRFLSARGERVVYLSPLRTGDCVTNDVERLGALGEFDYFDGSGYFGYLRFLVLTNIRIVWFIFKNKSDIRFVHFSDLESVILGGVACRVLGIRFIYNIHDNFFQRYAFIRGLSYLLRGLESFYILLSRITIVPERFRADAYPRYVQDKIAVIKNIPDFDVTCSRVPFSESVIKLFYGGWVSPNRSLELYLSLAQFLVAAGYDVEMNVCGWGSKDYIEDLGIEFSRLSVEFHYLGQLDQRSAVDLLKKSDISIAYYSPDKIINLYAASNKIPEIIGSNTLLITNSQTEIAKLLFPHDISFQFERDISEIQSDLIEFLANPANIKGMVDRARSYYSENFSPDIINRDLEMVFKNVK
ncbi:MAG: hypothetical protein HWE20_03700 [Gammaproteobacteria bacterium]|nr:hypothetical protein [Gammaproteobacteria bacterium]